MIIVNSYNYFRNISFSRPLLYEASIMNFFNTGLIFTQKYLFYVKKVWVPRGPGTVNFDILVSICLPGFVPCDHWTITFLRRLARQVESKIDM